MWLTKLTLGLALIASATLLYAQQPETITDGVNGTVAVKPAATSPAAIDKAHVVAISPNNTGLPVNLPVIVNKASANIGGATVKTLTDTITATKAGNSLIVDVCAGSVANGSTIVLTMTETGGSDTWTLAATQAQSTTFGCSIYYATNITAGVTAVIATFSGGSSANTTIAMEAYEVSGLIALSPQVLDTTALGNATSTAPSAGPAQPDAANDYAFAAFGIGTAAQTVTLGGTGTWVNDSGQVNPASGSGLLSFVGASQFRNDDRPMTAAGTITSEPWVAVEAIFRPVQLGVDGTMQIYDGTTNVKVIAGTNALKVDTSSVAGTATSTAASGVQKVGVVGNAGAVFDGPTGSAVPANAILMGGTDGTNTRAPYMDPCAYNTWTYYYVNVSSNTQIAGAAGSSLNYYICQIAILPVAGAANVNLVSSATAGNACATSTTAFLTGGTTAATGATLTTNGGFILPSSGRAWAKTQATNHAFCIFASAAVTGVIAYVGPI
jgi:hypothetical protein